MKDRKQKLKKILMKGVNIMSLVNPIEYGTGDNSLMKDRIKLFEPSKEDKVTNKGNFSEL